MFPDSPPFQFVWYQEEVSAASTHGSQFSIAANKVITSGLVPEIGTNAAWGLWYDSMLKLAKWNPSNAGEPLRDFAVIAVYRRSAQQLWTVLSGLSGPGTLAAAMVLESNQLPHIEIGHMVYHIVEVDVEIPVLKAKGDPRHIGKEKPRVILQGMPYDIRNRQLSSTK
jgi:hypothetical protein